MNAQRKGAEGERELAVKLRELGFDDAVRNGQNQRYTSGRGNPDVELPGLHIEVKRTENLRLHEAVTQATCDARSTGAVPVVASRRNRGRWLVTMYLDDWAPMYQAQMDSKEVHDNADAG